MEYLISFIEGIITFISPCMLPMLPIYLSYFAGGSIDSNTKKATALKNSIGFVLGFSIIFILLGVLSSTIGAFLLQYRTQLNILFGVILIVFGLNYMGVFKIGFLNVSKKLHQSSGKNLKFFSSVLFGLVFAIGWTPCVGTFLGSAMMLAAGSGTVLQGTIMLALFSLGLGIPFILSAVLLDQMKSTFNFIKKHYKVINIICGALLIVLGFLVMSGMMNRLLGMLS